MESKGAEKSGGESKCGTIKGVDKGRVWVTIERKSACAQCHAKSHCLTLNGSDEEIFEVEIPHDMRAKFNVGDSVELSVTRQATTMAMLLTYVIPTILIIAGSVIINRLQIETGIVALLTLSLVILYFCGLYALRGAISGKIKTTIKKCDE